MGTKRNKGVLFDEALLNIQYSTFGHHGRTAILFLNDLAERGKVTDVTFLKL